MMARTNVPGVPPLLEELLDHAQGNPVVIGDFLAGAFVGIVGSQDAFTQIQRQCLYATHFTPSLRKGYGMV
jgi:hypothetical protein